MHKTALLLAILLLAACAKNIDGNSYTEMQVGQSAETFQAVVLSARQVTVTSGDKLTDNGMGMVLGGAAGGLGGNQFGQGKGNTAATIGGVVAGAAIGALAQSSLSEQQGMEYIVRYWQTGSGAVTLTDYAGKSCTDGLTECAASKRSVSAEEKLITMVQGLNPKLDIGQRAFLILTPTGRSRLVPDMSAAPQVNQQVIDTVTTPAPKK